MKINIFGETHDVVSVTFIISGVVVIYRKTLIELDSVFLSKVEFLNCAQLDNSIQLGDRE